MSGHARLHLKTAILLALMVLLGPLGDVCLGKGMRQIGRAPGLEPAQLTRFFVRSFESPLVWAGIAALLTFFVVYLLVLSYADYSFVQPSSAFAYVIIALLGYFVLGEAVSAVRWLGVVVISLGVFLVGRTPPRTTEQA
ncbi:MAG TPA: EamA family transporter [Candidatus Acidoferrales bacterium]|nr:EamA family transporter [Candidatus Acidoferrales bacterium]